MNFSRNFDLLTLQISSEFKLSILSLVSPPTIAQIKIPKSSVKLKKKVFLWRDRKKFRLSIDIVQEIASALVTEFLQQEFWEFVLAPPKQNNLDDLHTHSTPKHSRWDDDNRRLRSVAPACTCRSRNCSNSSSNNSSNIRSRYSRSRTKPKRMIRKLVSDWSMVLCMRSTLPCMSATWRRSRHWRSLRRTARRCTIQANRNYRRCSSSSHHLEYCWPDWYLWTIEKRSKS